MPTFVSGPRAPFRMHARDSPCSCKVPPFSDFFVLVVVVVVVVAKRNKQFCTQDRGFPRLTRPVHFAVRTPVRLAATRRNGVSLVKTPELTRVTTGNVFINMTLW